MSVFLRRFWSRHMKNGLLSQGAFFCNDGLSFYIRESPLDCFEGVREMCNYVAEQDARPYGAYELSTEDLKPYGLWPELSEDEADAKYGKLHYESLCLEDIIRIDDPNLTGPAARIVNLKKAQLAALANGRIIVALGGDSDSNKS